METFCHRGFSFHGKSTVSEMAEIYSLENDRKVTYSQDQGNLYDESSLRTGTCNSARGLVMTVGSEPINTFLVKGLSW